MVHNGDRRRSKGGEVGRAYYAERRAKSRSVKVTRGAGQARDRFAGAPGAPRRKRRARRLARGLGLPATRGLCLDFAECTMCLIGSLRNGSQISETSP